jgi:hypothetical protein
LQQARQFPQIYFKPHQKIGRQDVLMTLKVTAIRRKSVNSSGLPTKSKMIEMQFRTNDDQLLGLWTATRLIGEIRGLEDREGHDELVTKAQILLTAFLLGLEPLGPDPVSSAPVGIGRGPTARFDA